MHSGGTDGTVIAPVRAPDFHPAPEFVAVAERHSSEIPSIFLGAHVFEHASSLANNSTVQRHKR